MESAMHEKLTAILEKSSSPDAMRWLKEVIESQQKSFERRPFYYAFSGVSRHFDKRGGLEVSEEDLSELNKELSGFSIGNWDQFRLARVLLLLVLGGREKPVFLETVAALLNTADIREQTAIFSAFPLLPHPEELVETAVDGLRTNIVDIYDSIALNNPFPSQHFSDEAWKQMVLKSFFIERPLHRIYGIDYRANANLSESLSNLAHERWAAGRWVSPELWRSCANFLTDEMVENITRVAGTDEPGQKEAAALVLAGDEEGKLDHIRDQVKTFLDDVADGRLTWDSLGEQL